MATPLHDEELVATANTPVAKRFPPDGASFTITDPAFNDLQA
jgi:hypothetical protein